MKVANFSRIPVGELVASGEAELKTGPFGTQLKASDYTENGTPVINVRNIGFGTIKADKLEFISPATRDRLSSHLLRSGDIVFGRKGAVERHVFIRKEQQGWFQGSDCLRLRFSSPRVEPLFASYCLLTKDHQSWMMNQCSHGATMASLNQGILERIELPLPPLPVQQRIAGILSAYDDLIENSQRRIKILESMARALYREWFVNFRFPGHEGHPRVASPLGEIPEGWEVKKLENIISAHIGGGWGQEVPVDDHTEPAWVIRGTDIPQARYSQVDGLPYRFHTVSNLRSRRLVAGDIVFEVSGGSKGQPVGRTLLVTPELLTGLGGDVICASFCKRVQPDIEGYGSELLYLSFLEGYESGEIEQYQVQSTGISNFKWTDYIANTNRVLAPAKLRNLFRGHVAPILIQIAMLGRKIQNFRRTRDLLLPRLLSGQIDVSAGLPEVDHAPPPTSTTKGETTAATIRATASPEAVSRDTQSTPAAGEMDREEILITARRVFGDGMARDHDTALRELAQALGYQRLGKRIKEGLSSALLTAVRRGILVNNQGEYTLGFHSLEECTRDSLKADFLSSLGRAWTPRTEAIQAFARYLGFARVGHVIDDTARSLINGLIREGHLESEGPDHIRRT